MHPYSLITVRISQRICAALMVLSLCCGPFVAVFSLELAIRFMGKMYWRHSDFHHWLQDIVTAPWWFIGAFVALATAPLWEMAFFRLTNIVQAEDDKKLKTHREQFK